FTMTRVTIINGLGPVLQIAEGWSVELPNAMNDHLDARTHSTWPTTWFAPRITVKDIALATIGKTGSAGGTGHGVDFCGDAIRALSMEGRLTLRYMTTALGANA
ncbi:hypothetical protein KZC46_22630, partial [Salmonella enterica subsp. enterica serovar Javiana]|nr:hypothetical protein [Salmonella enterica subsp. enterica serovar Javiana]